MASLNRREIEGLLGPHFPTMVGASSDDWHAFLNAKTELDVPISEDNSSAFDKWRQALSHQGYTGVWDHTPDQIADMKKRGELLLARAIAGEKAKNGV
jgi:hypothetical protein